MSREIKCQCGNVIKNASARVALCVCGRRHPTPQISSRRTATLYVAKETNLHGTKFCPVNTNANICRQCPSGRYEPATDTCGEVIDRGKAKKQNRGGKINWLHFNRGCPCPLGHFDGLDL